MFFVDPWLIPGSLCQFAVVRFGKCFVIIFTLMLTGNPVFLYLGFMFISVSDLDASGLLFCILVLLISFAICWYMLVDQLTT